MIKFFIFASIALQTFGLTLHQAPQNQICSFSHSRLKLPLVDFRQVLLGGALFTDESFLTGKVSQNYRRSSVSQLTEDWTIIDDLD